jgi:hypothetical protein
MDRVRDEFEVWWASNGGMDAAPDEIEFAFTIWAASRDAHGAVCIREVMPNRYETDEYFDGWVSCKAAIEDVLDKAGVQYE